MGRKLEGKRIAILATDGVEQIELTSPREALEMAGAVVVLISPKGGRGTSIRGWDHDDWGRDFEVDRSVSESEAGDFDGLLLPGGVMNPDALRTDADAVRFVRSFFESHTPVAAICHAPWVLVEADVVRGRKLTSYPSLRTDLRNAGAEWVDQPAVVDQGLVTSRRPSDLEAFNHEMVEEFAAGRHAGQRAG